MPFDIPVTEEFLLIGLPVVVISTTIIVIVLIIYIIGILVGKIELFESFEITLFKKYEDTEEYKEFMAWKNENLLK